MLIVSSKTFEPLAPIPPESLYDQLGVHQERKIELLKHFDPRHWNVFQPERISLDNGDRKQFEIAYDNGEAVQGHCLGAEKDPKQALVWVGGFTERSGSKLPSLFERVFRNESVVQFYYEVSPPIEFITLSRYQQDMEQVLRYVGLQPFVQPEKTVLIARSINALIAAKVASQPEYLKRLRGLILVAPVFDLIEMINNYRANGPRKQNHVTLEKCCEPPPDTPQTSGKTPRTAGWSSLTTMLA